MHCEQYIKYLKLAQTYYNINMLITWNGITEMIK